MPDALFEIEIPHRLLGGLVFGFLKGFLELAVEDVFLLAFGFPGIAELVLALARLFRQDARGVVDIDVGRGLEWRYMREYDGKFRVHRELGLAARASHFDRRCGFLRHAAILCQKWLGPARKACSGSVCKIGQTLLSVRVEFPGAATDKPEVPLYSKKPPQANLRTSGRSAAW